MPLKHLSVAFHALLKVLMHKHETCFPKSQAGLQIITKPFNPYNFSLHLKDNRESQVLGLFTYLSKDNSDK